MGADLVLILPSDKAADEQLIDDYYDYIAKKEKEYGSTASGKVLAANSRRERSKERLAEYGKVLLSEHLFSDMRGEVAENSGWMAGFEPKEGTEIQTIYGDDIADSIKGLRKTKTHLILHISEHDFYDKGLEVERTYELQPIAVCEFALNHGYGIFLSV